MSQVCNSDLSESREFCVGSLASREEFEQTSPNLEGPESGFRLGYVAAVGTNVGTEQELRAPSAASRRSGGLGYK